MSDHFQHTPILLEIAMKHPIIGVVTAVSLSAGGYLVPALIIQTQIPFVVMQSIQIFVWGLAAVASYLTIKGYFKKNKE